MKHNMHSLIKRTATIANPTLGDLYQCLISVVEAIAELRALIEDEDYPSDEDTQPDDDD